ncbi:hypothetical protein [Bizionia paragorgiae]|uniref:hypothetical protein n=1 Tax=Bizionia paragorgiae TaxID=283786 RepID=UPI003A8FAD5C
MKTLKLFFFIALIHSTTNAQITKGNWLVGGNASFSYQKTEPKNDNTSGTTINYDGVGSYIIHLEPNIGYFIYDKFAVGTSFSLRGAATEISKFNFDSMNLGINPFVRYYFLNLENNYNLFFEPSYYQFISNSLGNSNGFGLKTGFIFFLNSSVGVETVIKYSKYTNNQFKNNSIQLGFGLQIHLEKL